MTSHIIERIMIFSGGGLISIVRILNDKALILTRWPEDISLSAMKLVAIMLKEFHDRGNRVIIYHNWVAYIPEESQYISMVKFNEKRHVLSIIGFIRRLSLALKNMPEDSLLIGKAVVEAYQKHFRLKFSEIIRR